MALDNEKYLLEYLFHIPIFPCSKLHHYKLDTFESHDKT